MSYTLHQSPDLYTPVNNPMRFVVASSNYSQTNYQYFADIYVSGQTGYTRILQSPDLNYNSAFFDISEVLRSSVTKDAPNNTYGFQRATNSYVAYEVKFGEQYGASSGIIAYPNITVTGLKYAFNGVFSQKDFCSYVYTTYVDALALSNQPTTTYLQYPSSNRFHSIMSNVSGTIYYLEVLTYNSSGALLGTYLIENADQAVNAYNKHYFTINAGVTGLNGATLASGSQPVITSSVAYYDIRFRDFANTANTIGSHRFTIDTSCTTSPIYTVHFRNEMGGLDSFDFIRKSHKSSDTQRDKYTQSTGTRNSASSWTDSVTDRGDTIFNTKIADKYVLESDWITDSASSWLRELIESPEVYIETSSAIYEPAIVVTNSYETKTIDNEKMFTVQVTLELANKRWRQRG